MRIDPSSSNCIAFDSEEKMITITCRTSNLTAIDNQLKSPVVLHRDEDVDKGWILNAGITIAQNSTLYINSSDTSWLKIIADGETAYPILITGSLKIDSAKITSWNPNTNNYTSSEDSHRNGEDVQMISGNVDFFFKHEFRAFFAYIPHIESMRNNKVKMVTAIGKESDNAYYVQATRVLAAKLGCATIEFPGHHDVSFWMPEEFASAILGTLERFYMS